jgi:hypothetical protein
MASKNKKKKLKNSYCWGGALKEKDLKIKKILFYNSALRQKLKQQARKEYE